MNQPYSRFFWRDYEQDLNLSACHPFAQAMWMRMLCVMQQGEPYGHLRMEPRKAAQQPAPAAGGGAGRAGGGPRGAAHGGAGGVPSGVPDGLAGGVPGGGLQTRYTLPRNGSLEHLIFSRCGVTEEQMQWSIAHLEEHGVFSRTPEGIIYCRRMVREFKNHADRVERARKAYEKRERRKSKNPPDDPTRKTLPKRGNPVEDAPAHGGASGTPRGGASGAPRGGAGGIPTGGAITIANSKNYNPTPPTPPAQSARGATEPDSNQTRKPPAKRERLLAAVDEIQRRAEGGTR